MAKSLGRAIQSKRVRYGYSQEAFAAHAKIDRTYMSAIERGKRNVSLRSLMLIAGALQMKTSELLAEAEEILELENEG